ncbi:MAG TPA: rhodanese-like domain-containing protein [Pirellulales bacterium]|jgi:rhodanese-related sulfurtransferase|nr:rhodanese-like domain-containing protein [Pirellulales bacterium]
MADTNAKLPMETTCQAVKAKLDAGDEFLLLDCRELDEHELVRIEGSRLLPMSQLMVRAAELEPYRSHEIVVHCHHGGRSLQVTQWLRQQGYSRVQSMAGGIDRWACEIEPQLARY